jgi:predicted dehydrogenase
MVFGNSPKTAGVNQKLRLAVLGLGYFGKHYVRLIGGHFGVELVATADNAKEAQSILGSSGIDGVVIATPAPTHFELASLALKNGKHVLLEKPMVMNLAQAQKLKAQVKKSKKVLLVGHQYWYHDYIRTLKKELDGKVLGQVKYIFAQHFYHGPIRKDIGCFWETATHELSILEYLFGPLKISDIKGSSISLEDNKRDDAVFVNFTLNNKIAVSLAVSWFMPEKKRNMVLVGQKGSVVFDDAKVHDKLIFAGNPYPKYVSAASYLLPKDNLRIPKIKATEPLLNELDHFIDCIRNSKKPLTDVEHGVRITKLLDLISSKLKKV